MMNLMSLLNAILIKIKKKKKKKKMEYTFLKNSILNLSFPEHIKTAVYFIKQS
jgi:hypothetical protein